MHDDTTHDSKKASEGGRGPKARNKHDQNKLDALSIHCPSGVPPPPPRRIQLGGYPRCCPLPDNGYEYDYGYE